MTRDEFLQEAALRLIMARPEASMYTIASEANTLTDQIFESVQDNERWWSDEADKAPVNVLIKQIEESYWQSSGYGVRLTKVFKECNIMTVGDLLRVGRYCLKNVRDVGAGSLLRIDRALEELYNITSW